MKCHICIANITLENNPEQLVAHIQDIFPDSPITQLECSDEHRTIFEKLKSVSLSKDTEWILVWDANERWQAPNDFCTEKLQKGVYSASIVFQSARLRAAIEEYRLIHKDVLADDVENACLNNTESDMRLSFTKPLLINQELADAYDTAYDTDLALAKEAYPVKTILYDFGRQRYREVIGSCQACATKSMAYPSLSRFFQILSHYNYNEVEVALGLIYETLDSEAYQDAQKDFAYLFGKLAQHVDHRELKKEALELLLDALDKLSVRDTQFVTSTDSDLYVLIAELQIQLNRLEEATQSLVNALQFSQYTNESAAHRLAAMMNNAHSGKSKDEIARLIMENFDLEDRASKRLLFLVFNHLQMIDWAQMFYPFHESSSFLPVTSQHKLVSIILPVYNDNEYLYEAIHSILTQTYSNLELIVVDDGSHIPIDEVLQRFWYDLRIQVVKLDNNQGLPAAINYGLKHVRGAYATWISADNTVHTNWLENMVSALEHQADCAGVVSDYYHIDEHGIAFERKALRGYTLNGFENMGPSFLWRSSVLSDTGGFNEAMFGIEDRDFSVRLALSGTLYYLPEPLYYYRIHTKSLSTQITNGRLGGWEALHDQLKRKWFFLHFV
ncbi:glycosyltransferase family 2 protein [Paenibacillus sedimenti]|uniref:Glycosyltransferase family 2 protein n=1 Tax=Paenibacillus sedimenti TaxID=2770274 RepID=A0A926KSQ4_9BACL|nr:glycosyltransferase family A protein [Paenibacillus sedimenti]MBD0382456.1 glycosyltransferase family 2 protein [Paenibacillus sedimenti]